MRKHPAMEMTYVLAPKGNRRNDTKQTLSTPSHYLKHHHYNIPFSCLTCSCSSFSPSSLILPLVSFFALLFYSQMSRKQSISSLLGVNSPFSKSSKIKPPLTDKQRYRAQKKWQIVRENLKLVLKMKNSKIHSSNVDRKITRIVIDNDDLGNSLLIFQAY